MSLTARAGAPVEVVLQGAPTGLTGQVGVRVLDQPAGTVVVPRATSPVEQAPGSGVYAATLAAPAELGGYLVVWDTGGDAPRFASEELQVLSAGASAPDVSPPVGAPAWAPTIDEVAALVASYTREYAGGYQRPGDAAQAGRERSTFTASTDPTLEQVEEYVRVACQEVLGRVGVDPLPDRLHGLAHTAARWHACASVSAKRQPTQAGDNDGLYRAFVSNYTASLRELSEQARYGCLTLA